MSFTDYLEAALLNLVFRNVAWTPPATVYLALFTATPGETGVITSEVTGASYARQPVPFAAPANQTTTVVSSANVDFLNMPASTVTHGALMSTLTGSGGLMLAQGALTIPQTLPLGAALRFLAGQIQVQLS